MKHPLRVRLRLAAGAAAASLALAPAAVLPATAGAHVKVPKSGTYSGRTHQDGKLSLAVSGKEIQVVGFEFDCRATTGHTSLQGIKLHKTKKGYRFKLVAHSIVSYDDGHPDQNAAVSVRGRFSKSGKRVAGRLHVQSPRCDTGRVTWSAKR